ncbi:MAG TPA: ATP-dependent DNA ligase [Allosphingosinicella sp.]|nr:ATP-dependent DNA ligase [Allosphingosinicella sp.]
MTGFAGFDSAPPLPPMEAKLVDALPDGAGWQFEPKWDGFRCLVFRDGDEVVLQSKSGRPLDRYFPEVAALVRSLPEPRLVLDGELIVRLDGAPAFDALQMRLHPAESRIRKLAAQTPACLMLFDCLMLGSKSLREAPLAARRAALEAFHRRTKRTQLLLSPATSDRALAQSWLGEAGGALDGVVAKRLDEPYRPGERAMLKVKLVRSADCVVGGFRYGARERLVGSLLLGLYDEAGRLDHVGFTSSIQAADKPALTARLERLIAPPGFTGKAPGAPSRWSGGRSAEWQPLRPELVVEVRYDQVTGGRFRHGTGLLRWRPDKAAAQCTVDQIRPRADFRS